MNRLTKRYLNGNVTLDPAGFIETQETIDREIRNFAPAKKAVERLAEYEDAEEQGLLVHLPCKVGDTVYINADDVTFKGEVIHFIAGAEGTETLKLKRSNGSTFHATGLTFGVDTFLTPEAAQQALKERADK